MVKNEGVKEFIARGGKVTVLPPAEEADDKCTAKSTACHAAAPMTFEDADLIMGEEVKHANKGKPKAEKKPIDVSLLPESLLKRLGISKEK
jgi:hypothetical protein